MESLRKLIELKKQLDQHKIIDTDFTYQKNILINEFMIDFDEQIQQLKTLVKLNVIQHSEYNLLVGDLFPNKNTDNYIEVVAIDNNPYQQGNSSVSMNFGHNHNGYNNNGYVNVDAIAMDTNGDGYVDAIAMDTNGDGYVDAIAMDTNGDGYVDAVAMDTDFNGSFDAVAMDTDFNGGYDTLLSEDNEGVNFIKGFFE